MKDQFDPVRDNEECEKMIVVDVERMTARREFHEFKTDYWYWEKGA